MAATPEGKVKDKVRKLLREYNTTWFFQPVSCGYGDSVLDFICAISLGTYAVMFSIETKAAGKRPTDRQLLAMSRMQAIGIRVFVVDGEETLSELRAWLDDVSSMNRS